MFDRDRFKALVHLVCARCSDDPSKLGSVKLNKVLWFSDVIAYAETGSSITGARFVKQKFGPVPKAIVPTIMALKDEGKLRVDEVEYYGHKKHEYVSLSDPTEAIFSEKDREIIDIVIDAITTKHTASSISDLTHDAIWKLAEIGEEIPLHAVLASNLGEVDDADIQRAQQRMMDVA